VQTPGPGLSATGAIQRLAAGGLQVQQRNIVANVSRHGQRLKTCTGFGLNIEITESMLLQHLDGTSRKPRELRAADVHVPSHNFGTGYSAFRQLRKLPSIR